MAGRASPPFLPALTPTDSDALFVRLMPIGPHLLYDPGRYLSISLVGS